jgi:uncharacterized membrane protein YhhN
VAAVTVLLWGLVAGFAVLDWYAVWRGQRLLEWLAKPLTMVALAGAAWSMGAPDTASGRWLLAALALGLLGDIALLSESESRFLAGLTAFLLGHLALVAAFLPIGPQSLAAALPGVALVVLLVAVVGRPVLVASRREGGAGLAGAVTAYMLVIGAMVVTAWGTGELLVAVGASVFMVSDAVLAHARFVRPWRRASLLVMVTYHLGQVLIVLGLLG